MNRENLKKLADYLEGPLKADFNMSAYCEEFLYDQSTCGSVGCALGHGPYAGIPKTRYESWNRYSERAFGFSNASKEWGWIFSSRWSSVDNSPIGAAKRIRILLDEGLPANAFSQWCSY